MNKSLTPQQALIKAASYCAYQERCHSEVEEKLAEWGIYGTDAGEITIKLVEQNYLNEERFARAFAGGKFRVKQWGRNKIRQELKAKKISEYCINAGMKDIDEEAYIETLTTLAGEKLETVKDKNPLVKKHKIAQYLIGKGYESDLIWTILRNIS